MPTYTSTVPEIFTNPPEKSISQGKKSGQLTDELVKQYFDQVTPVVSFVVPLSTICFSVTLSLLISSSEALEVNFPRTYAQGTSNIVTISPAADLSFIYIPHPNSVARE